jgi:hypothetical protein
VLIDIDPNYLDAVGGKGAGGWQTDISQAQDTNLLEIHSNSLFVPHNILRYLDVFFTNPRIMPYSRDKSLKQL